MGDGDRIITERAWTSELAYAVGLLVTDGNLSPDGRHINFTSKDREQVVNLRNCLGLQNRIGLKSRGVGEEKKYYVVQFSDVSFYRQLVGLGLSPRKSRTISRVEVPGSYFFDFLRGNFDGDGSVNSYWDPRWPHSFMFYLRFSSGSRAYLNWLQETIGRLGPITGTIQKGGKSGYDLAFAKQATRRLYEKMYYSDHIPYLARKRERLEEILEIDNSRGQAQVEELADSPA